MTLGDRAETLLRIELSPICFEHPLMISPELIITGVVTK